MKKYALILFLLSIVSSLGLSQRLYKAINNAHQAEVLSVDINDDGSKVITGSLDTKSYYWDVKSGKKEIIVKGLGVVAFNPDYRFFSYSGADNKVTVIDIKTKKPVRILKKHTGKITDIEYNPVNENIATSSEDGNAIIWDSKKGSVILKLSGHSKTVTSLSYSSDGKLLITGSLDKTVRIWDAFSGQMLKEIPVKCKGIFDVKISNDNKYIACTCDSEVILLDSGSGNTVYSFSAGLSKVKTVDISSDVRYVAAAGQEGRIVIWKIIDQSKVADFDAHNKDVNKIKFSANGKFLASVGNDGALKIWDESSLKIGDKKFAQNDMPSDLVCSKIVFSDENSNGIIEIGEKSSLNMVIKNNGEGQAYDVVANIEIDDIEGLKIDKAYKIGNIGVGSSKKVSIPFEAGENLVTTNQAIIVNIKEANGNNLDPVSLTIQTKGKNNSYIMVADYNYESISGVMKVGEPVTLKLSLQNVTNENAENIVVKYILPSKVVAVNKLSEKFETFGANEIKELSMQFYADEGYESSEVKIELEISGAAKTNINDIDLTLTMNDKLPVNPNSYLAQQNQEKIIYRGGVDPLKGLNVASAEKEMVIGDYYALIIGIDKYQGTWTPLNNAVNDAKAVEAVLRAKYKFDKFITLYDTDATREAIIQKMEWLVENVKSKDNVFIYYSGHGEFKKELNKGYWVPVDAKTASTSKYISNSDIQTFLGGINSSHTLLVADACFSGDIFRGNTISVPFEQSDKYYQKVNSLVSRQAISSGGLEPVMDGGRDGHSVFSYYLLKSLKNNNSKYYDAGQLFQSIKIPIVNNSNQSPNIAPISNTGDEGGQFLFIKK